MNLVVYFRIIFWTLCKLKSCRPLGFWWQTFSSTELTLKGYATFKYSDCEHDYNLF